MARGHVNRENRPGPWAHRPMLQKRQKVLARAPSARDPKRASAIAHPLPSGHHGSIGGWLQRRTQPFPRDSHFRYYGPNATTLFLRSLLGTDSI